MSVGLQTRFKRLLKEIVTLSHGIRHSALDYANGRNFNVSERLRHQLEIIRISADAILQAFAIAYLTSYSLDDRVDDWLASKEPHLCLEKLKEMNDLLRPVDNAERRPDPSLAPAEDKLAVTMAFFDEHESFSVFAHFGYLEFTAIGHENGPQSAQAKATDRKKELLHQKLGEISRWLTPMECIRKHKDALRLRQEGTCKWFPNTDVYERWRAPGNHFLWLHGKGGCGKSVLIASTIEHLKTCLEEEEVVVFFYCDFQNKRSTSSMELIRSILSQLLRHIRDCGVDPGDFPDNILKQKSDGALSLDDLQKLCHLVSRAASFFRYEPMIVIDALDECADIETLLPELVTLSQSDVRLLVTSRPDQTIMNHFAGLQSLSFENVTDEIGADIALHVRRELNLHNRLRSAISETKNEIDTKLIKRAEGRFRWVQCQLDALKRCPTEGLREALDSLPNELGATYERILGAVDERKSEGELARRVLALLMAALEPLQVGQIVDGLSMDFQEREHNHESRQWLKTKLLPSLSSLVSYYEETDVIALSHYSVKEYLTSGSALPMYQIPFHQAHAEAVRMCMGYISVYLKRESSHRNLECFPMLFYVLSSGFNHLAYVDSESAIALEALQSLGSDIQHHPSHWDRLCELREETLEWPFAPWPSSKHDFVRYILIAYSPPGLLRTFLSTCRPLGPRIRTNPLVYAADLRKTEHAMVLLAHGADMDARGLVIDDSYRASPLEVAIDLGGDVLVGELLMRGCLMTSDILSTAVCMPWCSTRVLAKLMQTDEFAEWALDIGEEKLYRSVFNSARPNSGDSVKTDEDHVVLARRLRQLGVDLSAEFGRELIERALHAAHISMLEFLLPPDEPPPAEFLVAASAGDTSETIPVVRLLLQKGVDVHVVSGQRRDTAVHLAAMCPWEPRSLELTRLLIDAGCKFHALNSNGETPLIIAMRQGHYSVVELLLSCNAPLPSNILQVALERRCNPRMIELLLHRGANVDAVALSSGNTILHCAIVVPRLHRDERGRNDDEPQEWERLGLVNCFLKAGCDPTTCNSSGATALELAMERNFTSVVKLLISPDVPLPPNALLIAIRHSSNLEMVEYLVQRGADMHSTTSDGDTVLHLALSEYDAEETRCELVQKLINAGCDTLARNCFGETALEIAMQYNFTSVVELLISPDVPLPPDALLIAVRHSSSLEMVEYLFPRGADVHSTTFDGDTILHLALSEYNAKETRYELVKKLIDAGCDTLARNFFGETALEMAIGRNLTSVVELLIFRDVPLPPDSLLFAVQHSSSLEMVEYLIQRGADAHSTTSDGDTILHLALSQYNFKGVRCELAKKLINAGCDTLARNSSGETALEIAMQRNITSVVELLISPDVPLPPDALLIAVRRSSNLETVEYLIRRGVNVHSTMSDGDTILHLALSRYYPEETCCKLVKMLINAGCDTTERNATGKTPLEIAIRRSLTSVVELLSSNAPLPANALLIAVRQGWTFGMIEYLISKGADVCSNTSDGDAVLHLALKQSYFEKTCCDLVKILINAGCDTTVHDSSGKTPLEIAMQRNFTSVVELLLPSDAPLPRNVLLIAIRQCSTLEMVEYLIQRGADLHSTTSNGDTVLHLALAAYHTEEEHCKFVQCLINAGCDASVCNSKGNTVLLDAMECSYPGSVVKLLLSFNISIPPNILHTALQRRCEPQTIDVLVHKGANNLSGSDWDTLLQLAYTAYHGKYSQQVVEILEAARKACKKRRNLEDETCIHVAKRPRLEEREQPVISDDDTVPRS